MRRKPYLLEVYRDEIYLNTSAVIQLFIAVTVVPWVCMIKKALNYGRVGSKVVGRDIGQDTAPHI